MEVFIKGRYEMTLAHLTKNDYKNYDPKQTERNSDGSEKRRQQLRVAAIYCDIKVTRPAKRDDEIKWRILRF